MILKSTVFNAIYNNQYLLIAVNNLSFSFVSGTLSISPSTEELSVVPGWIRRVSPVVHRLVGVRHVPSHRLRGAVSWMWRRNVYVGVYIGADCTDVSAP